MNAERPRPAPQPPTRPTGQGADHRLPAWTLTLVHGPLILVGTTGLALLLEKNVGFYALFAVLAPGFFVPFSFSAAASLHRQRGILAIICFVTLLASWPWTLVQALRLTIPLAAGTLAGEGIAHLAREGGHAS